MSYGGPAILHDNCEPQQWGQWLQVCCFQRFRKPDMKVVDWDWSCQHWFCLPLPVLVVLHLHRGFCESWDARHKPAACFLFCMRGLSTVSKMLMHGRVLQWAENSHGIFACSVDFMPISVLHYMHCIRYPYSTHHIYNLNGSHHMQYDYIDQIPTCFHPDTACMTPDASHKACSSCTHASTSIHMHIVELRFIVFA